MNKVIAVVGMSGSGKSVATETLEKQGWHKIYLGGITYQKMKEAGITITPDSEKSFPRRLKKKTWTRMLCKIHLARNRKSYKDKRYCPRWIIFLV